LSGAGAKRLSVAGVRRSYGADKRWEELSGELPALLIFRPISFYLTPLFARAGFSPSGVTWLSLAFALALPLAAWRGGAQAHWLVFALGFAYQVLDCVDGNLARATGRSSAYGELLELVTGQLYWIAVFVSLGLLCEARGGGMFGSAAFEVTLALPLVVLLNRLSRNHAEYHFGRAEPHAAQPQGALSPARWLLIALAGLENLYIFGIALTGSFGGMDWLLFAIAVYVVGVFVYVELGLLRDLGSR
jgi:phosphatidylglycerophosphate synthase